MCSMPSRPKDNSDLNGNAKDTVRFFRPGLLGLKKVHFQTFANIHKNLFNWCSHALAFHLELSQLTYWVFCDSFKLSFYLWQIDGNGMCSHVRLFWAFGRFWSFAPMSHCVRDETVTWHRTRPLDGSCTLAVVLLPLVPWSPCLENKYQNQNTHPHEHRGEQNELSFFLCWWSPSYLWGGKPTLRLTSRWVD